jgi:hypothetical protein
MSLLTWLYTPSSAITSARRSSTAAKISTPVRSRVWCRPLARNCWNAARRTRERFSGSGASMSRTLRIETIPRVIRKAAACRSV